MFKMVGGMIAVVAGMSVFFNGVAAAGNGNEVRVTAPKTVTVNYTQCIVGGNPSPCLSFETDMTNISAQAVTCELDLVGVISSGDLTFDPGQLRTVETTTPYLGQRFLIETLTCDGQLLQSQTARIRVLAA
jgi:hypothetical protein